MARGRSTIKAGGVINYSLTRKKCEIVTFQYIEAACRHLAEMVGMGARVDLARKTLVVFVEMYARMRLGGVSTHLAKHHVLDSNWSDAAKILRSSGKTLKTGDLQVEHGTPQAALADLLLDMHRKGLLSQTEIDRVLDQLWVVAVVTRDEHRLLTAADKDKSKMCKTPFERWRSAGISFTAEVSSKATPA